MARVLPMVARAADVQTRAVGTLVSRRALPRRLPCRAARGSIRRRHDGFPAALRLPRSTCNTLLRSCATPPVNLPIASIFCDWNSAVLVSSRTRFASVRSVMSRVIFANPASIPSSSRIASITTCAQKRLPSFLTRHPSASNRPSLAAAVSPRCGSPVAASSGV